MFINYVILLNEDRQRCPWPLDILRQIAFKWILFENKSRTFAAYEPLKWDNAKAFFQALLFNLVSCHLIESREYLT